MLSDRERADRRLEIDNCIANQRLAGRQVDTDTLTDLYLYANGDLDLAAVRERVLHRLAARVSLADSLAQHGNDADFTFDPPRLDERKD